MTRTAIEIACAEQDEASDPRASVFVSASAGSGKTKLLIDRLLRLMLPRVNPDDPGGPWLPGADPGRILCLTFTKAAAAEMAIRLQRTLGAWVTLPDAELDVALRSLRAPVAARAQARALFARVLDMPGGMRIGTIHAFCQSLLRRFPLEAAINPHFQLMEDTDASLALQEVTETELARLPPVTVGALASQIGLRDFTELVTTLKSAKAAPRALELARRDPEGLKQGLSRALGVGEEALGDADVDPLLAACADIPDENRLRDAIALVAAEGAESAKKMAVSMLDWLSQHPPERAAHWSEWRGLFLTSKGEPRKNAGLNKKLLDAHEDVLAPFEAEAARILRVEEVRRARVLITLTLALLGAAAPVIESYGARKSLLGQVEYDDLIARTLGLLRDPGSAWVLYKLDGGVDHLLLDEVQDTSRVQWEIAGGLTSEFFVGEGARDPAAGPRTVFAVGDYKQSIYGFQGADPDAFRDWRRIFERRVRDGGGEWREPALNVSFRSTAPVLKLVDSVFAHSLAARGVSDPGQPASHHESARPGQGGRVELWPLVPRLEQGGEDATSDMDVALDPWAAPTRNAGLVSPPQRLADTLARWIAAELLKPPAPGERQLTPGDVLVLVPRRSAFVRAFVRALKSADVPVATLVRTGLADQTVVQDLLALCDALLLPQDDLTLACVLTSPLGGLADDSLMALAMERQEGEPLWTVLRERHAQRPDWATAWHILSGLFRRVDYLSPYGLLSEALGAFGGRARLLARLGPEAGEPIDELLSASLRYEDSHAPSLQGFLHWLRQSNESVKREPEASSDAVRVMTAHGSKGLQARLVILPDTTGSPRAESRLLWLDDRLGPLPVLTPRSDLGTEATRALRETMRVKAAEEYNRLLYVALTRASDRLVVCGWEPRKLQEESWYARCLAGFEAAEAGVELSGLGWGGQCLVIEERATVEAKSAAAAPSTPPPPTPMWMGAAPDWRPAPPPREPALARPLSPSRPDDVGMGERPASRSPLEVASITPDAAREAAFRRGALAHALLQFLPDRPAADRTQVAYDWLLRPGNGLDEGEAARLVARVLEVMEHAELEPLFAPEARAEQRLAGVVHGNVVVGQVDRMRVLDDTVMICDFKTNRRPPVSVERTPVLYLRQMAAYRDLLRALYPGRIVRCSLVWTEAPMVMELPDALLDEHEVV
ncbi:DNA helicase II [Acetobacter nitrogenifigens DSM 23921 = NBRC 105050]|uniref:DNA 3'-5' helicase n=1 Tax=Acetobacter nitrogenifigens DSM 23921 = NBRC 105050 TaxID=1120919 RepID=A0A511X7J7_9PROT|nr:double-strand break repair helicase AddA [Acetobacter nitrogenifigens]GBQ95661.1 DNA helicase II [Acetobacter nitrogenifigens DSM 23921 = NBRC 105050]GEN58895.1 double-strand break repair helicase AddA [Acetobacter nitrogenifigens DSM 23921 = NBRC 105050]